MKKAFVTWNTPRPVLKYRDIIVKNCIGLLLASVALFSAAGAHSSFRHFDAGHLSNREPFCWPLTQKKSISFDKRARNL